MQFKIREKDADYPESVTSKLSSKYVIDKQKCSDGLWKDYTCMKLGVEELEIRVPQLDFKIKCSGVLLRVGCLWFVCRYLSLFHVKDGEADRKAPRRREGVTISLLTFGG